MGLKEEYLTISEAASHIGVTRQTISRWIKKGKLEAEKVGREKVINKKALLGVYNVYREEKVMETVAGKALVGMAKIVREEYGYGKDDKIEPAFHMDPKRAYMTYTVIRKDGSLDRIRFYPSFRRVKGAVVGGASKLVRERYIKVDEDTNIPTENEEIESIQ